MVEQQTAQLDAVFHALADPTRRLMLQRLAGDDISIGALAAPLAMSFAGASKHVRVLEDAGLLRRLVRGRCHICRIEPAPLAMADDWLRDYERYWTDRVDILESILRKPEPKPSKRKRSKP
ncbi:MAG TPA: metalloregulator ArsR/SmtB family transcription factor [Vineibacter sp.]|nr:metalloregulator ArsR/SmtB family transcription factor [Vineibacter sp.]